MGASEPCKIQVFAYYFVMTSHNESISFGRYLQAIRLEKKISLEKVAGQTRIGLGNLLLIEQEDHERLPAEVFVKGFLRSYAGAIGADGDEAIRRYETRLDVAQKIAESEASIGRPAPRMWWKLLISLGLFIGIMILSVLGVAIFHDQPGANKLLVPTLSAEKEKVVENLNQQVVESEERSGSSLSEKLSLQVTALEDTWLKVIIDDKGSVEYSLTSGDRIELKATSGYDLLIGDARGLKISLNDKPVSIPGESGQTVTIHLP
jgi:transcriptional regulator with XRE-family HTH domain